MFPDFPTAFNPYVSRTVNHDFADVLIFEDRFQARQKRPQVIHAAGGAHIFPAPTARQ